MKEPKSCRLINLLKEKFADSTSETEINQAKDNLIGFFHTLLEIARENPNLIDKDAQIVPSKEDYKH